MNTRQRQPNDFRLQKYLNFLLFLSEELKQPKAFNIQGFVKDQKISANVGTVLIKEKIVKYHGRHNRLNIYSWEGIKPNVHMALRIMDEVRKYNAHNKKEIKVKSDEIKVLKLEPSMERFQTKTKALRKNVPVKKQEIKESKKEISIMWGLFKVKY